LELTGEAASPEHVLSDAFRVTHFEKKIGQWLGYERKTEKLKFPLREITCNRSSAKPNLGISGDRVDRYESVIFPNTFLCQNKQYTLYGDSR
jgi:hypothetical protein